MCKKFRSGIFRTRNRPVKYLILQAEVFSGIPFAIATSHQQPETRNQCKVQSAKCPDTSNQKPEPRNQCSVQCARIPATRNECREPRAECTLYNSLAEKVAALNLREGNNSINTADLKPGVYFYKVTINKKLLVRGKWIKI